MTFIDKDSSLNSYSEFKNSELEQEYRDQEWKNKKKYFFTSYFICTLLFFFHGLFDFKREFVVGSPYILMTIRGMFLVVCSIFIFKFRNNDTYKKGAYEFALVLKLFSVLIIFLLTIFTDGKSPTLPIGVLIMISSFYLVLPGRALYGLISSILVSSTYWLFAARTDMSVFSLVSFIILASNIILWVSCRNAHRFLRFEFIHHLNLEHMGSMKNKIITTLAHDIRSPLSVIFMRSDVARRIINQEENPRLKIHMEGIYNNSVKINELITDLIDWTLKQGKEESGNIKLSCISSPVINAVDYVNDMAQNKDIELSHDLELCDIPHDPIMVEAIIRNLVTNAVKFSKVSSNVQVKGFKQEDYFIHIKDTANIMTKEQKRLILSGNNDISETGTTGEKGSGIGLKLVHTFLKAHDARMDILECESGNTIELKFKLE